MSTDPTLRANRAVMRPVRRANAEYRVREHLTEAEVAKLLGALKGNYANRCRQTVEGIAG